MLQCQKRRPSESHLSMAVGSACVAAGYAVRFFTTTELAFALSRASREHTLEYLMKDLSKCDLLILDEPTTHLLI